MALRLSRFSFTSAGSFLRECCKFSRYRAEYTFAFCYQYSTMYFSISDK